MLIHSGQHIIKLLFAPILSYLGLDLHRFESFIRIYLFIQNGLFGSVTFMFAPIFYSVIALRIGKEFSEWNKQLIVGMSSDTLQANGGIIEELRLRYENLIRLVQFSDHFMSSFLGINLVLHITTICFLSYNAIMYWGIWKDFFLYIVYCITIIAMLVLSCSMVTKKVCMLKHCDVFDKVHL